MQTTEHPARDPAGALEAAMVAEAAVLLLADAKLAESMMSKDQSVNHASNALRDP
jgi:hypothetical protein